MRLERDEVRGIFGVLVHVVNLDQARSQDERHFLLRFLEAIGHSQGELEEILAEVSDHPDIDWHVERIRSRRGRIYALQQALLLALSDGEYRVVEREGLLRIADKLGIDEVLFEDLEQWALEGSAWQIRGAALLAR